MRGNDGGKTYYTMDPMGKLRCHRCRRELVREEPFSAIWAARFMELPVCPNAAIYVPEELATGKVLSVERSLRTMKSGCPAGGLPWSHPGGPDMTERLITLAAFRPPEGAELPEPERPRSI
ncbi:MAG: hypothetical protein ACLUOI_14850 [Eisenbergiella sp.]